MTEEHYMITVAPECLICAIIPGRPESPARGLTSKQIVALLPQESVQATSHGTTPQDLSPELSGIGL